MRKLPLLAFIPPVAFAFLAGLFYTGMMRDDPDALPSVIAGQAAPPMQVDRLGNLAMLDPAMLEEPGTKIVNFWASWCAPCRTEHPILERLADEGVTIYGVNYKDQAGNALSFLQELGNPYAAVGADRSGRTGVDWGVYGVPETYVIDGDGTVVLRFAGPITERVLEDRIRPALDGAGAS